MRKTRRLIEAFLDTDYAVRDGNVWRVVRIGERHPGIEKLSRMTGVFITGWNPFGKRADAAANAARNRSIARILAARGYRTLPHQGIGSDGDWAEDGFFVREMRVATARNLARTFGQLAIVSIARGRKAELIWAF
jgi:hypothetical protein